MIRSIFFEPETRHPASRNFLYDSCKFQILQITGNPPTGFPCYRPASQNPLTMRRPVSYRNYQPARSSFFLNAQSVLVFILPQRYTIIFSMLIEFILHTDARRQAGHPLRFFRKHSRVCTLHRI